MKTNYSDIAKTVDVKNTSVDTSSSLVSSKSDRVSAYANLASESGVSSVNYVKGETESKVAKLNAAKYARSERSVNSKVRDSSDVIDKSHKSKGVKSKYTKQYLNVGAGVLKTLGKSDYLEDIDKPIDFYYDYKTAKRIFGKFKSKRAKKAHINSTNKTADLPNKSVVSKTSKSKNIQGYKAVSKKAGSSAVKGISTSASASTTVATAGGASAGVAGTTVAGSTAGTIASGATAAGAGGGMAAMFGAAAAPIAIILGIMLVFALLPVIIGAIVGSEEDRDGYGNLEGVCLEICQFLREKGVGDVQIAAICGNIWGESGYRPAAIEYDSNGNELYGHGLCQWSFGRWTQLKNYASVKGKDWTNTQLQLEFLWAELTGEGDAAPYTNRQINWGAFCAIKDVDEATSNFCKQFERPANPVQPKRQAEARRVYAELQSGGNQDYGNASEKGKAIANACNSVPSPGAGWCAKWVSDVYQRAGFGRPGGNACDMYWNYCKSSDRSQLEVGMIIAVPTHPWNSAGQIYGHVGIYAGNGIVMHNAGAIERTPLDQWIATYGRTATVRWGWA